MTIQRQTNISYTNHNYDRESGLAWIAPRWRRDIAQMPPAKQAETIARARELAAHRPGSYLARNLATLYTVSASDARPEDEF